MNKKILIPIVIGILVIVLGISIVIGGKNKKGKDTVPIKNEVNVKENKELGRKYVIFSAPTTMIFKDGKMVKAISGYQEKETILNTIKEYL